MIGGKRAGLDAAPGVVVPVYDSANAAWPRGAQYLLAYIDGLYANVNSARATGAIVATITVAGDVAADCADIEPGCMSYAQGADWANRRHALGLPATQYFPIDALGYVQYANNLYGVSQENLYLFCAHYDGDPTIPPGFVGKQYIQGNIYTDDVSSIYRSWVAFPQPLPPAPPVSAIGVTMPQYVHFTGKTGTKSPAGHEYENGLVAECSGGVATNMGNNWTNVEDEYKALGVPLPLIPDPNGTLLDSYETHKGF